MKYDEIIIGNSNSFLLYYLYRINWSINKKKYFYEKKLDLFGP